MTCCEAVAPPPAISLRHAYPDSLHTSNLGLWCMPLGSHNSCAGLCAWWTSLGKARCPTMAWASSVPRWATSCRARAHLECWPAPTSARLCALSSSPGMLRHQLPVLAARAYYCYREAPIRQAPSCHQNFIYHLWAHLSCSMALRLDSNAGTPWPASAQCRSALQTGMRSRRSQSSCTGWSMVRLLLCCTAA